MKIIITKDDADEKFCGVFQLSEWITGGRNGYGDQFNAQAVVILTKAIKILLNETT